MSGGEVTPQEWRIRRDIERAMWWVVLSTWCAAAAVIAASHGLLIGLGCSPMIAFSGYKLWQVGVPVLPARPEPEREWS